MAERRTRSKRRTELKPQNDKEQREEPPKHSLLVTILASLSVRRKSKHSRGTSFDSILKFVRKHYDVYGEVSKEHSMKRVVAALDHGVKTGLFRKGHFGWYNTVDDPVSADNDHASAVRGDVSAVGDHVTRKRKCIEEIGQPKKWARRRINKEGNVKSTRAKSGARGLLRQQRRVNYSLYMSSSESEQDSDSSLSRMVASVDTSSYVKNKEYRHNERTLRKVYYPDYYAVYGSDSDSDPELYCPPTPYNVAEPTVTSITGDGG